MFCLLGVSIEFLCFPRPEEPIEHVMSCLRALCTLLETPCAKTHIADDQVNTQGLNYRVKKERKFLNHFYDYCRISLVKYEYMSYTLSYKRTNVVFTY